MPSLQYNFPGLSTTPTTAKPRSSPVFAKPSHFIAHAKRSRGRLHVSCSQNQNEVDDDTLPQSQGKTVVDRRNMLLGLGGLYGATNLVSTPGASAFPVQAPLVSKCGLSTYDTNSGVKKEVYCCPPTSSERIVEYKPPPFSKTRTRPAAQRVKAEYIAKYNLAIERMKKLPEHDPRSFTQQANIHCAYCNGGYDQVAEGNLELQIHNSWLFYPFHRWYLYFYERILGSLIHDPDFALPFWNWDNPRGMTMPHMFVDKTSAPIYDENRNQAHLPPAVVDLGMTNNPDPLQLVSNNLTVMHNEMVRGNSDVYDFMGQPYRQGTGVDPGPGSVERGAHNSIHAWVGDTRTPANEDMGNFYSAGRDPIFFCHHANVDRMWAIWPKLPSLKVPDKNITDTDFLRAAFVFYDENSQLVRVRVEDCLDHLAMGYDYERVDLPWLDYRPPAQTATAKVTRSGTTAANVDDTVFPLALDKIVRIVLPKTKKGKADELLVIENITVDTSKFLKFDVFVNDEDDNVTELDKASYAGTYAQVPHKTANKTATTSIRLKLTELYDDMDVDDDETVLVTLVPRHQGPGVTIGGIKIIQNPNSTN